MNLGSMGTQRNLGNTGNLGNSGNLRQLETRERETPPTSIVIKTKNEPMNLVFWCRVMVTWNS